MSIQSTLTPAQLFANGIATQESNSARNLASILSNGVPARPAIGTNPATPAMSAADIENALGTVAVAQINVRISAANQTDPAKLAAALAALQ
jgi:hypothetical protein